MSKSMWMIRAAEGGQLAGEFLGKSLVAIGCGAIGDLSVWNDRSAIAKKGRVDLARLEARQTNHHGQSIGAFRFRKTSWPG